MENCIYYSIWTIRISGHAIWAFQLTFSLSKRHERDLSVHTTQICYYLHQWHRHLLLQPLWPHQPCTTSTQPAPTISFISETREMWVPINLPSSSSAMFSHRRVCRWIIPKWKPWGIVHNLFKDLQHFLGFANFYHRFICGYSELSASLTSLLCQKPKHLSWTPDAVKAFQKLKASFCTAPALLHPDPTKPFIVEVDASSLGVGAVLSQRRGEPPVLHPCAFFLKKLSPAEQNYDISHDNCPARSGVPATYVLSPSWGRLMKRLMNSSFPDNTVFFTHLKSV